MNYQERLFDFLSILKDRFPLENQIKISDINLICMQGKYLPKNSADIYFFVSSLTGEKILKKIKNGIYEIDQRVVDIKLTELLKWKGQH